MGLFSKKKPEAKAVSYRALEFSQKALNKELTRLSSLFYDYRNDDGNQAVVKFLEATLNLHILSSATSKDITSESIAYDRGKIDAIRGILTARERSISDEKVAIENRGKEKPSSKSSRSYLTHKTQHVGGMSD